MTSINNSALNLSSFFPTQGNSGAQGTGRPKPDFSKLDTDGSGGLDQSEFGAMVQQHHAHAHAHRSGGADASSATSDTSSIDALFSKLDTNGDGSISKAELEAGRPQHDKSNNGLSQMGLSTNDFAQMMGANANAGGLQMQGPPSGPPPSDVSAFAAIDTDDNGAINGAEFGISTTSTSADGSTTITNTSTTTTTSTSHANELSQLFGAIDTDGNNSLSYNDLNNGEASDFQQKMQTIFGSLTQQLQSYGNQQYQWFSQGDAAGGLSSAAISYNA